MNLPEENVRVLVFDCNNQKWIIAHWESRSGTRFWCTETKMYYNIDRFTIWQALPEKPITK